MNVQSVASVLKTISSFSEEKIENYMPIITLNASLVDESDVKAGDENRVIYFLAAKTYYEICLMQSTDGVTSFSAGDIKITQAPELNKAKELYEQTRQEVAGYLNDDGFVFLGV